MGSILAGYEGLCGYERGLYRCKLVLDLGMMSLILSTYPQTHLREPVFRLDVCLEPGPLSRLSVLLRSRIVAFSQSMHDMSTSSSFRSGCPGAWAYSPKIIRLGRGIMCTKNDLIQTTIRCKERFDTRSEPMKYVRWISIIQAWTKALAIHVPFVPRLRNIPLPSC